MIVSTLKEAVFVSWFGEEATGLPQSRWLLLVGLQNPNTGVNQSMETYQIEAVEEKVMICAISIIKVLLIMYLVKKVSTVLTRFCCQEEVCAAICSYIFNTAILLDAAKYMFILLGNNLVLFVDKLVLLAMKVYTASFDRYRTMNAFGYRMGTVGYVILDNQSVERDRLNGIGFVLNFVKFILFTFGDKEMILVIEAISR
ncbi:hypothetical protein Tco_1256436 [Tanacetum coccineum]